MKRMKNCVVCDYEASCLGGCLTFLPILCCETRKGRRISHRRRSK